MDYFKLYFKQKSACQEAVNVPETNAEKVGVAQNLLLSIRQGLPNNSALLPIVNDHELFMRLSKENGYIGKEIFDLANIAKRAVDSVNMLQNVPSLNSAISIKYNTPLQWFGSSEMVEALLRNLLLTALACIKSGAVNLQIEYMPLSQCECRLCFSFTEANEKVPHGMWNISAGRKPGIATEVSRLLLSKIIAVLGGEYTDALDGDAFYIKGFVTLKLAKNQD